MPRRHALMLTALCIPLAVAAAAADDAPSVDALLAGPVEAVSGGFRFTEGPAHNPGGFLLFSDIPNNRVHKLDYQSGEISVWCDDSHGNNGIVCTADGRVFGGQKSPAGLAAFSPDGETSLLVSKFEGESLNAVNDLAIDGEGGVYFTDPVYGGEQTQPVQGVYYFSAGGELSRVIDDIPRPNGVNVSADGSTLYVADANNGRILAYDITSPGSVDNRRTFYEGDPKLDGGGPDGMCLDADGRLYATMKQIVVLSPRGELIGRIAVDEKPANCTFGGPEGKTLYVTARSGLYAVPMKVAGAALPASGPEAMKPQKAAAAALDRTYFVFQKAEANSREVTLQDLTLTIPSDWTEGSGSRMRLATYIVPAAEGESIEVQYVVFPPMGGSVKANVDRWVNQFKPDGRKASAVKGKSGEMEYVLADITGTYNMSVGPPMMGKTEPVENARMMAAVITVPSGGNYFIKMAGPAETVDAAADAFRKSFGADAAGEEPFALD